MKKPCVNCGELTTSTRPYRDVTDTDRGDWVQEGEEPYCGCEERAEEIHQIEEEIKLLELDRSEHFYAAGIYNRIIAREQAALAELKREVEA